MSSRSIDFAKTASIDLMTLNNKVVKMRQAVKQTKVHVISKLCKHITALKKKKGTDEQKAKNLRKAKRFIEEIDSIKKLHADKISKYSLANTISFSEISKMSLSPGPRALARLSDHCLMKKVVTDFREQHSDWRDLAAYLLIKQTGRRFKTKKQKQKKLDRCVENMNASETMTKTYIHERFGQEGLLKAELRFERKRKRPKSAAKSGPTDQLLTDSKETDNQITSIDSSPEKTIEDELEKKLEKDASIVILHKKDSLEEEEARRNMGDAEMEVEGMSENLIKKEESHCEMSDEGEEENDDDEVEEEEDHLSDDLETNRIIQQQEDRDDICSSGGSTKHPLPKEKSLLVTAKQTSHLDEDNIQTHTGHLKQKKNECVVKQLRLGATDDDDTDNDSTTNSESEDDDASEEDSTSSSDDNQTVNVDSSKDHGQTAKLIPEFLTKVNKAKVSDTFFADTDDDDDGENYLEDNEIAEIYNSEDDVPGDHLNSGKFKAKSMFYNQASRGSSRWSQRGSAGRGGFERRGAPGRFDRGQRGRTFRSDGRGGRGGVNYAGAGREWNVGGFNKTHPSQTNWNKHGNKGDRFSSSTSNIADHGTTRHNTHKGSVAADKGAAEKLHPSWEASKKRKAEQSGLTAFKGSKITFADDD